LDTVSGRQLWSSNLGGAVGGGVITYDVEDSQGIASQRIAVAAGFTGILWPTKVVTGRIVILGIDGR
jgi:alcohol dehydrogenase (cytochrome c)